MLCPGVLSMLSDLQDKFVLEKAPSCQKSAVAEIGFIFMSPITYWASTEAQRRKKNNV